MAKHEVALPTAQVESVILTVRGHKVILDSDLAALYGVTTSRLNQQVRRNPERFLEDFMFRLTSAEVAAMRSQFVIASPEDKAHAGTQVLTPSSVTDANLRSQFAISKPGDEGIRSQIATASKRNIRHRPYAFTEHGAIMAAMVLNSPEAVRMSVFVVRAFVKMREALVQTRELAAKLAELERKLTERLDAHEQAIVLILAELRKLMAPPPGTAKKPIGFSVRERLATYRIRRRR